MTKAKDVQSKKLNFYELALRLADAQTRSEEEYRWENFIDNLARICDEFAYSVHPKEKPRLPSLQRTAGGTPNLSEYAGQTAIFSP
jgi:hypothetical protein